MSKWNAQATLIIEGDEDPLNPGFVQFALKVIQVDGRVYKSVHSVEIGKKVTVQVPFDFYQDGLKLENTGKKGRQDG